MTKFITRLNTSNLLQLLIFVLFLNYKSVSPWENCSNRGEVHYREGGRQALCGSNRTVTNSTGIENLAGKIVTRTELTRRTKTRLESILQYLSIKGISDVLTTYSSMDDEDGIQFDFRKREDAYTRTRPEEYPYAVLLHIELTSGEFTTCSGTLLTDEWVLTASHCLYIPEDPVETVWVCAGCNSLEEVEDFLETNETLPHTAQLIRSETYLYHPDYPELQSSFDIGLVKAYKKFKMTNYVKTARLATTPWQHEGYRTCVTTGFGVVRDELQSPHDLYRKTHVLDVKKPCVCDHMVRFISYLEGDEAAGRMLCAKPKQDFGICSADSGGGLLCEEDGDFLIRGLNQLTMGFQDVRYCEADIFRYFSEIQNFEECGDKNLVSIFQDSYYHLPWINKHVKLFSNISEEKIMEDLKSINTGVRVNFSIWATFVNVNLVKMVFCKVINFDVI